MKFLALNHPTVANPPPVERSFLYIGQKLPPSSPPAGAASSHMYYPRNPNRHAHAAPSSGLVGSTLHSAVRLDKHQRCWSSSPFTFKGIVQQIRVFTFWACAGWGDRCPSQRAQRHQSFHFTRNKEAVNISPENETLPSNPHTGRWFLALDEITVKISFIRRSLRLSIG